MADGQNSAVQNQGQTNSFEQPFNYMYPVINNTDFKFSADLDLSTPEGRQFFQAHMDRQNKMNQWGMGANTFGQTMNAITTWVGMGLQNDVNGRYWDYMDRVSKNGYDIARDEMAYKEKALTYSKEIAEEQLKHDEKLAKMSQRLQITLAEIEKNGKAERTAILAANNMFGQRSDYFYGMS